MKKRIISFTLAKDEEDIIEAFVRHTVQHVDHMYVFDNLSSDGTSSILERLRSEGLPLTVTRDEDPAHAQARKTTAFFQRIIGEDSFDVLVLLDADEFFCPEDGWADDLGPGTVGEVTRYLHLFPTHPHLGSGAIRAMQHFRKEPQSSKAIYHRNPNIDKDIRIGEGSHYIYLNSQKIEPTPLRACIRHYALRSVNQYIRKNTAGWLAMILRNPKNAKSDKPIAVHWRREYEYVMSQNGQLDHTDVLNRLHGKGFEKLKSPPGFYELEIPQSRYDYLIQGTSPFTSLTKFAEQVCETGRKESVPAAVRLNTLETLTSNQIPMIWWDAKPNFGVLIGPYIANKRTSREPVNFVDTPQAPSRTLMSVGSLIGLIRHPNLEIWGTGVIQPLGSRDIEKIAPLTPHRIHAVRGYLTQQELVKKLGWNVPRVFGDPALLMPRVFTPEHKPNKRIAVCLHHSQQALSKFLSTREEVSIIDVTDSVEKVITDIASSHCCISSSLQGIIIAHAYGVPWVWLRVKDQHLKAGDFKFEDFFTVLDREKVAVANLAAADLTVDNINKVAETATIPQNKFTFDAVWDSFPE